MSLKNDFADAGAIKETIITPDEGARDIRREGWGGISAQKPNWI